jgi:hypothetical protein
VISIRTGAARPTRSKWAGWAGRAACGRTGSGWTAYAAPRTLARSAWTAWARPLRPGSTSPSRGGRRSVMAGDGCQGSLTARAGEGGGGHAALTGVARVRVSRSRTICDRCSWPRLRGRTCSGGNSVRVHPWCRRRPPVEVAAVSKANHHWHICEAAPLCAPRPHVRGGGGGQALTGIRRSWLLPSGAGPTPGWRRRSRGRGPWRQRWRCFWPAVCSARRCRTTSTETAGGNSVPLVRSPA